MKSIPHIVVQLIHIQGGLKGQIQEFSEPVVTIGRFPASTLRFPPEEPGVSREHAKVVRDGNTFKLITVKDTYGTFVNGKQVKETVLRNGDVIEFGTGGPKVSFNTEIRAESASEPEAVLPSRPEPQLSRNAVSSWDTNQSGKSSQEQPYSGASSTSGSQYTSSWDNAPQDAPRPPALNVASYAAQPEFSPRIEAVPQKVSAPLVIQFGPTIRTYRELPVTIGKHARCDFVLQHAGIYDQHAQIFFSQNCYWVKDLTGQSLIRVNGRPLDVPVRLNQSDEIQCSPQGPRFRFLGDGRLAEVESVAVDERSVPKEQELNNESRSVAPRTPSPDSLFSRLVKGFR